jgi:cytoskeletal protein CcmA (bactofilin family)
MAVGRISGPLLKSNLLRQEIDLSFETDLLYLDVNEHAAKVSNPSDSLLNYGKVGIKTTTPTHDLQVNGTTRTNNLIVDTQADIADITITGNTISSANTLNLLTTGSDTVVYQRQLDIQSLSLYDNVIETNESNANIELRPNGTGRVEVYSDLQVNGDVDVTGNVTIGGNITLGDADTDSLTIDADVSSNIIPDVDDTYTLGTPTKRWNDVFLNTIEAEEVTTGDLFVDGVDLSLRPGNLFYVSTNGDDANTGTHPNDPVASVKYALSIAGAGDTVHIYPGTYTEEFPLTVPVGVTVKGENLRSVFLQPTTATRYNDAFLLNGESTVTDLTIGNFYSGGNYFAVTATPAANQLTFNVGTAPIAHSYVSGGTFEVGESTQANVTSATYDHTTGDLTITLDALHNSHIGNKHFLSNLTFSCNGDTRVFPDNGYAFRFATDFEVTTRSPYIKNITVITKGSTRTAEDPRGFNAGDAGKGAYIDGAYATANSKEASMLFHAATFIVPGVDAITCTNGVRVEWLNSFTYFANRSFYCYDSAAGLKYDGKTRIRLSGLTGTAPAAGQTVTFTSTDSSTVVGPLNIESIEGTDILVIDGKNTDLIGFDTTPNSITFSGGGSATTIENFDLRDFGAEVRMIGSASVYGNYGLFGDGPGVIVYAIGHNLAYIGTGKEVSNDPLEVIQANEITELNDAKIRYNSVDHDGDFRVGDLFFVDQQSGTVNFALNSLNIDLTNGITFNTDGSTSFINGERIDIGNFRISGNTFESLSGDVNINAASGEINLNDNVNITGDLDVTGNITLGGNITIGDEASDTIEFKAGIDSDIIPSITSTYSLGTESLRWSNLYVNQVDVDDIQIRDNYIETTASNANLEIRANGTGEIYVPSNNVQINNNLTVSGDTDLQDTTITGTVTHTGDYNQTGDTTVTGNVTVTQDIDVSGAAQFEEILIDDNYITTTTSNADLELRASGTGEILVPNNDVRFQNDFTVNGTTTTVNITSSGTITSDVFTNNTITIDDNVIETVTADTNLILEANGTGEIYVPNNNVQIDNNLTVSGDTDLQDTNITGTITHVGNTVQTGNTTQTGNLSVTGAVTISSTTQFEDIRVSGNVITTTASNSDLELRASGTGDVLVPNNNVVIDNDLTVVGTISTADIVSTGTITANRFSTGDILIDDNFITTTTSNSNLELRANGTGEVVVPSNDVTIEQDLTVNGDTTLSNTTINGDITHVGNVTQTGDLDITGDLTLSGAVNVTSAMQFENIQIAGNVVETTLSNSDLDLRANGTGNIVIPNNDVVITNDLSIAETLFVQDIDASGTITANRFTTGDILIDDNYITTTTSNSNLELRGNSSGSIIIDDFTINNSTISTTNDLVLDPGSEHVIINSTGALKIPTGSTLQRPNTPTTGQIRYNTSLSRFEGYNGTNWIILQGVEDLDGDTRITAELTEGANDGVIRFYSQGTLVADLDATRLNAERVVVDDVAIDDNEISTSTTNTDLVFSAQGTGSVKFENFSLKNNTITNSVVDSITLFENTNNGYVKFDGTYGIVIPKGTSAERPGVAYREVGMTRYNTEDERVEVFDGTQWVSVAGAQAGLTRAEAEELAIAQVLIFG